MAQHQDTEAKPGGTLIKIGIRPSVPTIWLRLPL
jgi:hypothetical protein